MITFVPSIAIVQCVVEFASDSAKHLNPSIHLKDEEHCKVLPIFVFAQLTSGHLNYRIRTNFLPFQEYILFESNRLNWACSYII